ncbi:hypothetical protein CF326_g7625 [Tilletia indica]|nr:hypothetical protein CF326_g7625 [Tilletia indica]
MDAAESECVECRKAEDVVEPRQAEVNSKVPPPQETESKREDKAKDVDLPPLPSEAPALPTPGIIIEYCDRCRWQPRASWIQTELLLTFPCPRPLPLETAPEEASRTPLSPGLRSVTILPRTAHTEGGIFRVWLNVREGDCYDPAHVPEDVQPKRAQTTSTLLWDRKTEGRFPEPKELKQKIRDIIAPAQSLGHSDKKPLPAIEQKDGTS